MAENISVGSVSVDVVPDARKFWKTFQSKTAPTADRVGQRIGNIIAGRIAKSLPRGVREGGAESSPVAKKTGEELGKSIAKPVREKVRDGIGDGLDQGSKGSRTKGSKTGSEYGGAFARAVKARLEAGMKALPDAKIGADTSSAQRAIADIRSRMQTLSNQRLGVDISTTVAFAKIDKMKLELDELAAKSPDIMVRADAAKAAAELVAIKALAETVDNTSIDIDTTPAQKSGRGLIQTLAKVGNTSLGVSRLGPLIALSMVPSLLAVAAAAGAALAGVTALAAALGAGLLGAVAAVGFAFKGVGEAMSALQKRQDEAGRSAAQSAAQQVNSAYAIENAQRGVIDARRQVREATRGVADAERGLADAQRSAQQAQEDLSAARRQARRDLEDLTLAVESNRLSMRAANLAVERAQENLKELGPSQQEIAQATSQLATAQERYDRVLADPRATDAQILAAKVSRDTAKTKLAEMRASINGSELERKEAKLAYDQAKQRQKETAVALKRSVAEKKKADAAGIEGSDRVQAAAERVAQANRGVADAQRGVAAANRRVAAAQRGVVDAQRQLAHTMQQANARSAAGAGRIADEFDKLPKAGKRFVRFLRGEIVPQLQRLRKIAGRNLFPGLTAGLKAMKPLWRPIGKAVGQFATALGGLAKSAGKALGGKFWKDFVRLLGEIGSKAITEAGKSFGNLATAVATLFTAFAPLIREMLPGMTRLTERFAKWAEEWTKSGGFKEFIAYIKTNGPLLLQLIGSIVRFAIEMLKQFAPMAPIILRTLTAMFNGLTKIAPVLSLVANIMTGFGQIFFVGLVGVLDFVANFRKYMSQLWAWIRRTWRSGKRWVSKTWSDLWDGVSRTFTSWGRWIGRTASNIWRSVTSGVSSFFDGIRSAFRTGVDAVGRIWDGLKAKAKAPVRFVIDTVVNDWLIGGYNKLAGLFGIDKVDPIKPKGFATGGYTGDGAKYQPAGVVHAGEFVLSKDATAKLPLGALNYMNRTGEMPGYASGGLVAFGKWLQKRGFRVGEHPAFGGVAPVHSNGSLHYSGGAIDANFGPGGQNSQEMAAFDKIIRSGIASAFGLRSIWRYPGHFNHAHFDVGSGPDLGMRQGKYSGAPTGFEGSGGGFLNPFSGLIKKLVDKIPGSGKFAKEAVVGAGKKAISGAVQWFKDQIADLNPFGGGGGSAVANKGPIREIVQNTAEQFGWGKGQQWDSLSRLIQSESSWNPRAQNPSSSAYGLFQFLDGTWGGTGIGKTSNPARQALAGMRYIRDRYGNPNRAWAFKQGHNWYDNGGYIPPGVSTVVNGTGKPEPVFTSSQWSVLEGNLGAGGSGGPLIGEYNVYPQDAPAEIGSLQFTLRHMRRGGVYATG